MTYTEYKPYVIDTGYLFPPSLADFLGAADEVHIFREVVGAALNKLFRLAFAMVKNQAYYQVSKPELTLVAV